MARGLSEHHCHCRRPFFLASCDRYSPLAPCPPLPETHLVKFSLSNQIGTPVRQLVSGGRRPLPKRSKTLAADVRGPSHGRPSGGEGPDWRMGSTRNSDVFDWGIRVVTVRGSQSALPRKRDAVSVHGLLASSSTHHLNSGMVGFGLNWART
jgi:hypothetical protein